MGTKEQLEELSIWSTVKHAATSKTAKDLYAKAGHAAINHFTKEELEELSIWSTVKHAATSKTAKDLYAHAGHAAINHLTKEQLEELKFNWRAVAGAAGHSALDQLTGSLI